VIGKEFFFDERRRDVTENKGPPWKRSGGSGNVYENKGAYPSEAGMLLKRKVVKARQSERE
jgi:hypothetical protein